MTMLAMLLKPFIAILLFVAVIYPLKWLFVRFFPDGKVKALLLRDFD